MNEIITNQHLITVEGGTNVSICAKLMLDNNISSLVVTKGNNGDGILSGIITKSDLLDAYAKSFHGNVSINEYMTKKVLL